MNSKMEDDYWEESEMSNNAGRIFEEGCIDECSNLKSSLQQSIQDDNAAQLRSGDPSFYEELDGFEIFSSKTEPDSSFPTSARFRSGSETFSRTGISASEVAKLEAEVNHLQRTSKEYLPVKKLVLNMITDQDTLLEIYRSLEQKLQILDEAIDHHDGNAILRALLHLMKTTKQSIFLQELWKRPVAVNHYLNYLRVKKKFNEMADFYEMMGNNDEAAAIKYEVETNKKSGDNAIKILKNCRMNHFQTDDKLLNAKELIDEQLLLLERQIPIEIADGQTERGGKSEIFKKYPRDGSSLIGKSLLDTLYYCCLYHRGDKETFLTSPENIRKNFHLSDKQYIYVYVSAMAEHGLWQHMEPVLFIKGYLSNIKLRVDINLECILQIISKKGAPKEILSKYISHAENVDLKLQIAKTYNIHDTVIDTLVKLRDREGLILYKNKLPKHSREWSLSEDYLRRSDMKWKN